MGKADLSGVELALAGLTGEAEQRSERKRPNDSVRRAGIDPQKRRQSAGEHEQREDDTSGTAKGATPTRLRTRMGRPPGRKSGETPLKRKTTISISVDLMEAFADRSWREKCQLGELVERALSFYKARNWGRDGSE